MLGVHNVRNSVAAVAVALTVWISISDIKKAYKVIYREGNTIETANKILVKLAKKTKEVNLFVDFIDKSNRGLIR